MPTGSSVLVSSSAYLENPVIRDWVATHTLRRDGPDRVTYSDNYALNRELARMRERMGLNTAFDQRVESARKADPKLDRWLAERFISRITADDLRRCAAGTVGAEYLDYITRLNIELNVGFNFDVKTHHDFFAMRHSQNHDFDHIVTGGPFTLPTEMVPVWAMLANYFVHLDPEIAGAHHMRTMLASTRFMPRAVLHYPASFPMFLESMAHGISVGLASGPMYLYRYDDVLDLAPGQARRRLGVREVVEVDRALAEAAAAAYGEPDPAQRAQRAWAEDTAKRIPYNRRGVRPVATDSSVLVSSSKYLNNVRMRHWAGTQFLRRNGPDRRLDDDMAELDVALAEVRDHERIEALIETEARAHPALAACLAGRPAAQSRLQFIEARQRAHAAVQRRLFGVGDDSLAGVAVDWALLANNFRHLRPETAGELSVRTMLGAMRILYRTIMHYPAAWLTVVKALQKGLGIGQASDLLIAMPYEAVADLPRDQARERLGIRDTGPDLDTAPASRIFDDRNR
ncbi:MAG TPA: Coq4 family protein [Burkholderiales bacterium]|nr:Coq4 family protein [Burkholderiales bacterium]